MAPTTLEKAERDRETAKTNIIWLESKLTLHLTTPLTIMRVEHYIKLSSEVHTKLVEAHEKIAHCNPADMDLQAAEYVQLLDRLSEVQCGFQEIKQTFPATPVSSSSTTSTDIRLPRLALPTFDGNLNDWMSFRDMFTAAVHDNVSISKAQKLTYLKSTLIGEAAKQIKAMPLSDANYDIAWMQLKERYQNERELLFTILRRFVSQHIIHGNSALALRSLIDVSKECIRSLEVLKLPIAHWDAILLFHIFQKLDQTTKELWETTLKDVSIPPLKDFIEFLEQRARALAAGGITTTTRSNTLRADSENSSKRVSQSHHAQTSTTCKLCSNKNHPMYICTKFHELPVPERFNVVKKLALCSNCLGDNHSYSQCSSKSSCRICGGKHHSLIHKQQEKADSKETPSLVLSHHSNDKIKINQTILATALIKVKNRYDQYTICRAFLDGGSTSSFITEACLRKLGLSRSKVNAEVTGLGSSSVGTTKGAVSIAFCPHFQTNEEYIVNALVLPNVTGQLPIYACDPTVWPHLQQLQLADPQFHNPSNIDILLGADIFWNLLLDGRKTGPSNTPTGIRSTLGWLVAGSLDSVAANVTVHHAEVDFLLQRFWELESMTSKRAFTLEEQECENHFNTTHLRNNEGRFIVRLPLKNPTQKLGSSREIAVRRLKLLERRFTPDIQEQYTKFMKEYIQLGHMVEINTNEDNSANSTSCYIPHHYVIKDSSTTTKLRVVFDASSKTSSGTSLNDILMVGPTIQDTLTDILIRFRRHIIAFTADVAKMYRQIIVSPEDSDMQRIVWRERQTEPIKDYRLLTVTYGTASAPYLATKVLQQLAIDERDNLPLASTAALEDFYVDDIMSGATTKGEALQLQQQLLQLTERGGMSLRKWTSNSQELLDSLPADMRETNSLLQINDDPTIKTLGVFWNPRDDEFLFKINLDSTNAVPTNKLTKRIMLSEMSKLFDPMGWVSPVIIHAKILIQQLWKLNLGWDDYLPSTIQEEWSQYKSNLYDIEQLKIPRCILPNKPESIHLVGFADASEKAYAGVLYLCAYVTGEAPVISLLTSKTRVAPAKQISLPRLELCAAHLLAQQMDSVKTALKLSFDSISAWTDSTVTLAWIKAHPSRWKVFVANRVTEIQNLIPAKHWGHVDGRENPADVASRGIIPSLLLRHHLWWSGPNWLQHGIIPNMTSQILANCDLVEVEEKHIISCSTTLVISDNSLLFKYSTLKRLTRITAWLFRFYLNCQTKLKLKKKDNSSTISSGLLTSVELDKALLTWVKLAQHKDFHTEIEVLMKGKFLSHKSRILPLNPFLDSDSILRVGGRLRHSSLSVDRRHPILLPRHNQLTTLVIMNEHITNLHAGPLLLQSSLTRRFWIVSARDAIRQEIRKCIVCTRHRAATQTQVMGDLPASRITPTRAFLVSGIDYAGPFIVKPIAPRSKVTLKAYLAIFVCFSTRAVHLEVVSSLSTEAFLAALRRFIGRRGRPSDLHSDNGTNFVGANNQLKEMGALLSSSGHQEKIQENLSSDGINWHFNPPGAPHFGGLWEAGVKSVKFHLNRVIGNARLTFEELTTTMVQIEAILNSRPLTPVSNDPDDMTALTPGHFLIGSPLTALPEVDITSIPANRLNRWQLLQQVYQHFWRRWSGEYISRMQQRPKWMKQKPSIELNDLVLIKDDNLAPMKWRLGRVIQLHPGADGIVRVVTLKTSDNEFKRPITKLCLLPIDIAN